MRESWIHTHHTTPAWRACVVPPPPTSTVLFTTVSYLWTAQLSSAHLNHIFFLLQQKVYVSFSHIIWIKSKRLNTDIVCTFEGKKWRQKETSLRNDKLEIIPPFTDCGWSSYKLLTLELQCKWAWLIYISSSLIVFQKCILKAVFGVLFCTSVLEMLFMHLGKFLPEPQNKGAVFLWALLLFTFLLHGTISFSVQPRAVVTKQL